MDDGIDVLADLLQRARAHGAVFAHSTFQAPWGLEIADHGPLSFHAILKGSAWVVPPEGSSLAPVLAPAGDVVLVRSPHSHKLVDPLGTPARPLSMASEWQVPGNPYRYSYCNGGTGTTTVLLCGAFRFDTDICDPLLNALPPLVHLRPDGGGESWRSLQSAVGILAEEFSRSVPGQQTVLDRLLDLLLVLSLRTWFAQSGTDAPPWYRALSDPEVGHALRLIHADPAHPWTVDSLAARVGLSRPSLARRFRALVTEPPLTYLTRWRMTVAGQLLRETDDNITAIARQVGYQNEFAFATAFRRLTGEAPSLYRSRHQRQIA